MTDVATAKQSALRNRKVVIDFAGRQMMLADAGTIMLTGRGDDYV